MPDLFFDAKTRARLELYVQLLRRWNSVVNLVARSTLEDAWTRHIVDSAQLLRFRPEGAVKWVDLGSGAGLPGVVIALASATSDEPVDVSLIESDQRKAAFLENVSRETGVAFRVINDRIEQTAPQKADVVSARALAPLDKLCLYACRHLRSGGTALFLKGEQSDKEVRLARANWNFTVSQDPSETDPSGRVLALKDIRHA
jgi:16S rRNA (guanine527-N7)-methyltransferase